MHGELLERVLERDNLRRALKQVRRNKGAPGIDGMSVDELPEHLVHHWADIKTDILAGRYRPQPVRRVEIPKPDGRKRAPWTGPGTANSWASRSAAATRA